MKKEYLSISFWFVVFLTIFHIFSLSCRREQKNVFSTIFVSKEEKIIEFDVEPNFSPKEKYFLFYFNGYPWLKDYCIFISSSSLRELQTAIAMIDWQLWDKIYTKKFSPKLKIEIYTNTGWESLNDILLIKNFNPYQTTFWGSPVYDNIVLERSYATTKCSSCALLPLEESLFLKGLVSLNYKFLKPLKKQKFKVKIHILNNQ
jgi:hypothetical protein